jgi:AcrR family transcriptional regulator
MSRTASDQRPEELLDAIVDYIAEHGLFDLSLRPLAKQVGSSPRVLLYYFGSKEELIAKVFARIRIQQQSWLEAAEESTLSEMCLGMWRRMIRPDVLSWFQIFFEAYGQALRRPREHKKFLRSVSEDWIHTLARSFERSGCTREVARTMSTVILAGFRGFMLDYCATRDIKRIQKALAFWARALEVQLESYLEKNR